MSTKRSRRKPSASAAINVALQMAAEIAQEKITLEQIAANTRATQLDNEQLTTDGTHSVVTN